MAKWHTPAVSESPTWRPSKRILDAILCLCASLSLTHTALCHLSHLVVSSNSRRFTVTRCAARCRESSIASSKGRSPADSSFAQLVPCCLCLWPILSRSCPAKQRHSIANSMSSDNAEWRILSPSKWYTWLIGQRLHSFPLTYLA